MLSVSQAIIASVICAVVTFATRVIPFLFFTKSKPKPVIDYVQRYIPPMTMVILVFYCIRNTEWVNPVAIFNVVVPIAVTAILHVWKGNALLSIFSGTALYMVFMRLS